MIHLKIINTGLLIVLSLLAVACQANESAARQPLPDFILDSWQVTDVLIDQGKKPEPQGLDDKYLIPKYVGRVFVMSAAQIAVNTPYDEACEAPQFQSQKTTVADIIARSISSRFPDPSHPTAQDMGLTLAGDTSVEVLYLVCKNRLYSKDLGMDALADLSNVVWFIKLGNDQLIVSWHDQTLLTLSRVSAAAKPRASFNCSKAATLVEKTICGSVAVAAYDRSLAQTYKQVRAYYQSKANTQAVLAELKASQRQWLGQRDACGADAACLQKVMSIRIDDLIYDLGDYLYQNR